MLHNRIWIGKMSGALKEPVCTILPLVMKAEAISEAIQIAKYSSYCNLCLLQSFVIKNRGSNLSNRQFSAHRPGPQRPKLRRSPTLRKIDRITTDDISRSVHAVILAGGPSENPLARFRAMPAVELGEAVQPCRTARTAVQGLEPSLGFGLKIKHVT